MTDNFSEDVTNGNGQINVADGKFRGNVTGSLSQNKLSANRANAQKSSGPKTEWGKRFSSRNSRRHGLSKAAQVYFSDEEVKHRAELLRELRIEFEPKGYVEEFFVDKICADTIRLERAYKVEAAFFTKAVPGYDHPFSKVQYDGNIIDIDESIETILWVRKQIQENRYLDENGILKLMSGLHAEPFGPILKYALLLLNANTHFLHKSTTHTTVADEMMSKAVDKIEEHLRKTRSLFADRSKAASEANRYQVPGDQLVPIMRYRADAERSLFLDFLELERVQAKRRGAPVIPPAVLDVRT